MAEIHDHLEADAIRRAADQGRQAAEQGADLGQIRRSADEWLFLWGQPAADAFLETFHGAARLSAGDRLYVAVMRLRRAIAVEAERVLLPAAHKLNRFARRVGL